MAQSIKLKNNTYWDSKGITHNKKLLSDILYPVGSIYMSVNNTNPATLFGGSWTQISGRFLYCTTTSKTTGGSTTTGSTTLTIDQIPSHSHNIHSPFYKFAELTYGLHGDVFKGELYQDSYCPTENTGGGQGHTHPQNLPPYFTVFCWYRTA